MSYWSFGFPFSLHIAKIVIYLWCSQAPALPINKDVGGVILGKKTSLNWCFGTLSIVSMVSHSVELVEINAG